MDSYKDIFVAEVKAGTATVIKSWKGDFGIDSSFQYVFEKHDCAAYSSADDGAYVFFMNSDQARYCNATDPYYYFNEVEYLDQTYSASMTESSNHAQFLDSLEYERKFVVYGEERYDIKDKEVIFVQRHRFLNWFTRFTIEDFEGIARYGGFSSTRFHLVEKDYKAGSCRYDYVFWVTNTHLRYRVTDNIERRIKRKVRKACTNN